MNTKIVRTNKTGSWALPGDPITHHEFKARIIEAEKGSFYAIEESKKILK